MNHSHHIARFDGHQSDTDWYLENLGVEQPASSAASPDEWRDYTQTVRIHMSRRRRALLKNLRAIIDGSAGKEVRHE